MIDAIREQIVNKYMALLNQGHVRKMAILLVVKEFRIRGHRVSRRSIYRWAGRMGVAIH